MDSIKLKTVFGQETVIFTLKVLTVAEENKIRAATFGLSEAEQDEKGFDLMVNALDEYSTEFAEIVRGDETQQMDVKKYFAERSAAKERIAHYAFRSWLLALQPSVDFL
jgi:hypothetical protein